jgi:hypothetical protein
MSSNDEFDFAGCLQEEITWEYPPDDVNDHVVYPPGAALNHQHDRVKDDEVLF